MTIKKRHLMNKSVKQNYDFFDLGGRILAGSLSGSFAWMTCTFILYMSQDWLSERIINQYSIPVIISTILSTFLAPTFKRTLKMQRSVIFYTCLFSIIITLLILSGYMLLLFNYHMNVLSHSAL
jgi:hypothetical protein